MKLFHDVGLVTSKAATSAADVAKHSIRHSQDPNCAIRRFAERITVVLGAIHYAAEGSTMAHDNGDPKISRSRAVRVDRHKGPSRPSRGVRVDSTDDSLTVGERGPTSWKTGTPARRSHTSTTSAFPNAWCMPEARARTASFSPMTTGFPNSRPRHFLPTRHGHTGIRAILSGRRLPRGRPTPCVTSAGSATKFYTAEGNYDLVETTSRCSSSKTASSSPTSHVVKPEPHNEIPQAASAHDTPMDFVSLQPETCTP